MKKLKVCYRGHMNGKSSTVYSARFVARHVREFVDNASSGDYAGIFVDTNEIFVDITT